MKLSHFDRVLIHGLGLMSRPPLITDARDHAMIVDLIGVAAERATAQGEILALIKAADRVGPTPTIHRGMVHEIQAAMNSFDRYAMGAHLGAARGQK